MADENIIIDVKVNTDEAGKSLASLRKEYKEQQKALNDLTVGSKEYIEQLGKLGSIKDEIGDLNTTIKAFNPEGKIQAFSTVISGLASGFQAAQGAVGLFGASTEGVQKALLKVQSAMAFSEGIKGVIGLGDGFRNLVAVLQSTAVGQKVVTAGTVVMTTVQKLWNMAMEANPIVAIISAIVALGSALYGLTKYFKSNIEATEAQTKAYENLRRENEKQLDSMRMQIDLMNIRKATAKEIAEAELKYGLQKTANDKTELEQLEKMNDLSDEQLKRKQELYGELKKDYDNQILLGAKLGQAKKEELEKGYADEEKLRKENLDKEVNNYNEKLKKKQDFDKQQYDLAQKALEEQKKNDADEAKASEELIAKKNELYHTDLENKYNADLKALDSEFLKTNRSVEAEKAYNELKKQLTADYLANQIKAIDENAVAQTELNALKNKNDLDAQIAFLEAQKQVELDNTQLTADQKAVINEKYRQQEEQLTKESAERKRDAELNIASQLNSSLQSLSDAYFSVKKANLKKGSAEERKAAKEQFNINKALSITSATISGIQGVVNALSAQSVVPEPFGTALKVASAVAVGAAAVANIAKIASTKFEDTGGQSGTTGATGGAGAGAGASGVNVNSPTSSSTLLNADGTIKGATATPPPQKVVVVESDITEKQKRVAQLQENSKY